MRRRGSEELNQKEVNKMENKIKKTLRLERKRRELKDRETATKRSKERVYQRGD